MFNGHLHRLFGGIGNHMVTHQPAAGDMLEAELGDLKGSGMFRIVVVDSGMVSFSDFTLWPQSNTYGDDLPLKANLSDMFEEAQYNDGGSNQPTPQLGLSYRPPIVMITNPKDCRYIIPHKDASHKIISSPHIRLFIWNATRIARIYIHIDGMVHAFPISYVGTGAPFSGVGSPDAADYQGDNKKKIGPSHRGGYLPVWVSDWDPKEYDDGEMHEMTVLVLDDKGNNSTSSIVFRVDGKRDGDIPNNGIGGWIMTTSFPRMVKIHVIDYIS